MIQGARAWQRLSSHPVLSVFVRAVLEKEFRGVRAVIAREMALSPGVRTLEVGCGPGALSDLFRRGDYVGIDLDPRAIDHARRHRPGVFLVADARGTELPDSRFDQALVFGVLRHLADADVGAVMAECRRLVTEGGRLLVLEPIAPRSRWNVIGRALLRSESAVPPRSPEEYRRLYAGAGRLAWEGFVDSGVRTYHAARIAL